MVRDVLSPVVKDTCGGPSREGWVDVLLRLLVVSSVGVGEVISVLGAPWSAKRRRDRGVEGAWASCRRVW